MGRVNSSLFQHVLDRINGRLERWKAKTLTLAGRTVLSQAVLNSTPIYKMKSTFLPTSVCHAIDKKVRNFIWGGTQDKIQIHLVKWDTLIRSKQTGGLGI